MAAHVLSFSLVSKSPGGWPGALGQWESLGSTSLVAMCSRGHPPQLLGWADLPAGQVTLQVGLAVFGENIVQNPLPGVPFPVGIREGKSGRDPDRPGEGLWLGDVP